MAFESPRAKRYVRGGGEWGVQVFDTRSGRKEEFTAETVRMYVCGPTVYGGAHMGHARSYVAFDVIRRYLEYTGRRVIHVQNFTDVEDSITKAAVAAGRDPLEYAADRLTAFQADMDRLNVRRPHHLPKVTDHIPEIQSVVGKMLGSGWAYGRNGNVYFRARRAKSLGSLSHQKVEDLVVAGADPGEREDLLDFALWKRSKPGEPSWESPWGRGRPGWHVECYAMGSKYLGDQMDLHGGGLDLIYPHHESEEMISEAVTGLPWSRLWLHNGFLTMESEKMSKSLGNSVPLAGMLETWGPDTLRLCLTKEPYRASTEHDPVCFEKSRDQVKTLRSALDHLKGLGGGKTGGTGVALSSHLDRTFTKAMDDDFDTWEAHFALMQFAEALLDLKDVTAEDASILGSAYRGVLGVFGLFGF